MSSNGSSTWFDARLVDFCDADDGLLEVVIGTFEGHLSEAAGNPEVLPVGGRAYPAAICGRWRWSDSASKICRGAYELVVRRRNDRGGAPGVRAVRTLRTPSTNPRRKLVPLKWQTIAWSFERAVDLA